MSEKSDAILKELRSKGESSLGGMVLVNANAYADRIESVVKTLEADLDNWRRQALDEYARANATHKDSLEVGNAAALRVALSDACHAMFNFLKTQYGSCYEEMAKALDKAKLALAAPPRNCDVYETKAERQSAFINWHNETFALKDSKYAIDICDLKHNIDDILHEYIDFLFAEAKRE